MKKVSVYMPGLVIGIYFLVLVLLYKKLSWTGLLSSLGLGVLIYSVTDSILYAAIAGTFTLFIVSTFVPLEGFAAQTPPKELLDLVSKLEHMEGFTPDVTRNIMSGGYVNPGFGVGAPMVEGFEDAKVEKPAPASEEKNEEPSKPAYKVAEGGLPFVLGEIPSQTKNGPHIDAGATLISAIKSLNPEQIKAMTNDTQQLIETQKSLMGMLGTMKPMLSDGKQLMDTFQQMFG